MSEHVLIVDDEENKAADWAEGLRQIIGDRVSLRSLEDVKHDLAVLESRRAAARHDQGARSIELSGTMFDEAGILVVDYDLFELDPNQVLSGDRVAYLARCYSACGLIVGLNQDLTERWYDLTMLDHPEAFTDLSIGAEHLSNAGLWQAATTEFRPWHWPHLLDAADQYERCVEELAAATPDTNVLDVLGIDDARRGFLPRDIYSWIQRTGATVEDSRIATPTELLHETILGLRLKDKLASPESLARVVAARLRKWLEVLVLARQDILVDAPHLTTRLPALLEDPSSTTNWQSTCQVGQSPKGLGLSQEVISTHLFDADPWLSRAAWWWPEIASSADLDPLREEANPHPEFVFCEDCSGFFDRKESHRFTSRLGGTFVQRWVRVPLRPDGERYADYEPAMRLTL